MKKSHLIGVIILLLQLLLTNAITVRKKLKFTGKNKYRFLGKFAIGADNTGKFRVRARLSAPFNNPSDQSKIDVLFYEDSHWEHTLITEECTQKRQFRNFKSDVVVRGDGEWTDYYKQFAVAKGSTRLWYVAVADGEGFTHMHYPSMPKIEIEVEMLNNDSHFSQEDYGTLTFYCGLFVLLIVLFGTSIQKFYSEFKREQSFESPLTLLLIGTAFEIGGVFLQGIHLMTLSYDGEGFFIMAIFSRLSYMMGQVGFIWVLLMIGYGWTITYKTVDEKDIYIIMMLFVIMIHMMITALTFVDDDEYHKYHDFSGVQGIVIIILRLLILAAYIYGFYTTYHEVKDKKKPLVMQIGLISIMYIIAYPGLWILSNFGEPYMRKRFITFTDFTVQICAIYLMLTQFTRQDSKYYKASERSKGILPGSKFD